MNDFGKLVYEAKLVGETWLGKFGAWLENTLNTLMDGDRQKGSLRYNRNVVRTYLLEFTDVETVDLIEETYQVAVLSFADKLGISDKVHKSRHSGNFGSIIFNDEVFYQTEKMEELENKVQDTINYIMRGRYTWAT